MHPRLQQFIYSAAGADTLRFGDFQSLGNCRQLLKLVVWGGAGFDVTDQELKALVAKLPKLQRINLKAVRRRQAPTTTLRSLSAITASCSNIVQIALRVDASTVPDEWPKPHGSLRSVQVYSSPITNSRQVALYLHRLSTRRLELYHEEEPDDIGCAAQWKEVADLLPVLDTARELERNSQGNVP